MPKTVKVRSAFVAVVCSIALAISAQADALKQAIDIPAGELAAALKLLAKQSGADLVYRPEQVQGLQTSGVKGELSIEEAVTKLLEGTALRLSTDATGAMLIAAPLPADGRASDRISAVEEIVVTGTHLRGVSPQSAPVLVFTREEIEASGRTSVEQFMRTVPQNFQGGVNQENFNVTGSGQLVTQHGAGINLRGLGQRATLVLINGKRLAPSGNGSFVDVSLIPLSAIQRVEVLTDGASAIYGSDAVGGVVNFILRSDFEGFESAALVGSATSGDGDQLQLSQAVGTRWSGGNALVVYEYHEQDKVLAADRDYTINIPPTSFFLPQERRHSVLASMSHEFSDRVDMSLAAIYAQRATQRDLFNSASPLIMDAHAGGEEYSASGDLNVALGAGWNVQLTAAHSRTTTDQMMIFTDGQGVLNDIDTLNELTEVGIKADGRLLQLPAGVLSVAVGAQYRDENHSTGSRNSVDHRLNRPRTFVGGDRRVSALFAEANLPLVSALNAVPGIARLELNAAVRMEDYDSYGSTVNPKVGLYWSPAPGLSVRGTYGTSFRAPLLNESTGLYNAFYWPFQTDSLYLNPAEGTGIPMVLSGYDPQLTPEESETWTAGFEYQPPQTPQLKLGLNYFRTQFDNRIAMPTPLLTIVGNPAFESILVRDPDDALVQSLLDGASMFFDVSGPGNTPGGVQPADVGIIVDNRISNTAVTSTDGLDFLASYDLQLGTHRIGLSAAATYLLSFEDQLTPLAPVIDGKNAVLRPVDLRGRASISWAHAGWNANLAVNYTDDYPDARFTPILHVSSHTSVDLGIAYGFAGVRRHWLSGLRITLNAVNVLDADPPFARPAPGRANGPGYDPVNASGLGRFVSLQLRKSW